MTTGDVQVLPTRRVATTLTNIQIESQTAGNLTSPPGRILVHAVRARETRASLPSIHPDRPRASIRINDNICVCCTQVADQEPRNCKLFCCKSCTFCKRAFRKEGHYCKMSQNRIKICKICFLCLSIVFCQTCNQCPCCCLRSNCMGKTAKLLENLGGSGCQPQSTKHSQTWLHPPLSNPAELDKVTDHYKLLCLSSQKPLSFGGITSADEQKCSRTSSKSKISRVFQLTLLGAKAKQSVETHTGPEQTQSFLKAENFKMETPEVIRTSL